MSVSTASLAALATAAETRKVTRVYGAGSEAVRALDGVSVQFPAGTFSAVMGPSGSGKSTLLQAVAGLDPVASLYADRVVFLADGRVVDEAAFPTMDDVLRRIKKIDF